VIRCTVRGCGEPLKLDDRAATCPRGHHFDRAKAGYWNLLQPQDRRSLEAGDRKEVAAARRRLFEAGFFAPLTAALGVALHAWAGASPSPGGGFEGGGERGTEGVRSP
jgi:23S rRNA (guanine745-N1)-methyltransferase